MSVGNLITNAKGIGVVAIVVAVVLAVLQGFTHSDALLGTNTSVDTTANQSITTFITGITNFATFAAVIVLAIVGFFIFRLVNKSN